MDCPIRHDLLREKPLAHNTHRIVVRGEQDPDDLVQRGTGASVPPRLKVEAQLSCALFKTPIRQYLRPKAAVAHNSLRILRRVIETGD